MSPVPASFVNASARVFNQWINSLLRVCATDPIKAIDSSGISEEILITDSIDLKQERWWMSIGRMWIFNSRFSPLTRRNSTRSFVALLSSDNSQKNMTWNTWLMEKSRGFWAPVTSEQNVSMLHIRYVVGGKLKVKIFRWICQRSSIDNNLKCYISDKH